jgi:hypothetical protein
MDAERFDRMARDFAAISSRRRLVTLVAGLPFLNSIALLRPAESEAHPPENGRRDPDERQRRNRKDRQGAQQRRRRAKKNKKRGDENGCTADARAITCEGNCGEVENNCGTLVACDPCTCDPPCGVCEICSGALACEPCDPCCNEACCTDADAVCYAETGACCVPESPVQTCAGQCGPVANTCGQEIDCGSCVCDPPCDVCLTCDETTGSCVPNAQLVGEECGDGQVCEADGDCACDETSCGTCRFCQEGGTCANVEDGNACAVGVCCGGVCEECCARADCATPTCQACDEGTCVVDEGAIGDVCDDEGHVCQANGACACTCPNAIIAGGPGADDTITVDDDLDVFVNGINVFHDDDEFCQGCTPRPPDPQFNPWPPIALGCINNGDVIQVVASDAEVDHGGDNFEEFSPLYLHCPATGAVQELDAVGFPRTPQPNRGQGIEFYNQEFTVALEQRRRRRRRKKRRRKKRRRR